MNRPDLDSAIHAISSAQGRWVRLRPANRIDLPKLYEWRTNLAQLPSWTTAFRRLATFDEFAAESDVWLRDSITLVVIDRASDETIGFARAYQVNVIDGWAWLQGFAEDRFRFRRHIAEASALFTSYLFSQFPFRKLCSEIFEFNENIVRLHEKLGFHPAGRLRNHVWHGDRYWDLVQFEMFREDWEAALRRFSFLTGLETEAEVILTRPIHAQ